MQITLDIPEELAERLRRLEADLPQILELGLREFGAAGQSEFEGVTEVVEILAGLPAPDEIMALRPSEDLQARIDALLEKNRIEGLQPEEEREWAQYEYLEHLVRLAKTNAIRKLKAR